MEGGECRNGGSGGTPSFTVGAKGGMVLVGYVVSPSIEWVSLGKSSERW